MPPRSSRSQLPCSASSPPIRGSEHEQTVVRLGDRPAEIGVDGVVERGVQLLARSLIQYAVTGIGAYECEELGRGVGDRKREVVLFHVAEQPTGRELRDGVVVGPV